MGQWTKWWDDERKRWVDLPVPIALAKGSVTPLAGRAPALLGPDGRPLPPKPRTPMGFRRD